MSSEIFWPLYINEWQRKEITTLDLSHKEKIKNRQIEFWHVNAMNEMAKKKTQHTREERIKRLNFDEKKHGLWTSNESINQKYLKNLANVVNKICFDRT